MSAAAACCNHLRLWWGEPRHTSAGVLSTGSPWEFIPDGIVCSLPIVMGRGSFSFAQVEVPPSVVPSIVESVKELQEELDMMMVLI